MFYKYLDTNMFSVVTAAANDPSTITIYLINGVTGRIIYQFQEQNVSPSPSHTIASLFNEQYFALSFMRQNPQTGISQQELTVVELYDKKQEQDTQQLITDYFKGDPRITASTFSSFAQESEPEVVMETYILPFGVKAMALTETAHHVTGRSMVLVTRENKLYILQSALYSARRPTPAKSEGPQPTSFKGVMDAMKDELAEEEEKLKHPQLKTDKLPAYDAVLSEAPTKVISYDLPLIGLGRVIALPTRLESTTQVFAFGHDLFLARVKPDNRYDMLDESFNYSLLFAFIGFLICGNFFFARYLKHEGQKKAFLNM